MAKKKQSKKHRFKYTEPSVAAGLHAGGGRVSDAEIKANQVSVSKRVGAATAAKSAIGIRDFSYVGVDVRRIALFAVCLVALEAFLWYLFAHTGVGGVVYSSFSV